MAAQQSFSASNICPQIPTHAPTTRSRRPPKENTIEYSKNATKNMGKLLLKWIKNNQKSLRESVHAADEEWDAFLKEVKVWRGMNSLTRQFLIQNWHSDSPSARIFRIIACHFFRRQFRGSLYASRIGGKGQYMALMGRFRDATGDPNALNSLS